MVNLNDIFNDDRFLGPIPDYEKKRDLQNKENINKENETEKVYINQLEGKLLD